MTTVLIETKYCESSKCLEAKGPAVLLLNCIWANVPKPTKRSNAETQASNDGKQ